MDAPLQELLAVLGPRRLPSRLGVRQPTFEVPHRLLLQKLISSQQALFRTFLS